MGEIIHGQDEPNEYLESGKQDQAPEVDPRDFQHDDASQYLDQHQSFETNGEDGYLEENFDQYQGQFQRLMMTALVEL